jgi:hypothetical protein
MSNVISVCLCPGCASLTQMKPLEKNIYFCRVCNQKFRQYKNGKLMYVPLGVATAMEASKIIFEFTDELIKKPSPQPEEVIFEPEFDIDEDLIGMGDFDFEFDPDTDFDPDESN